MQRPGFTTVLRREAEEPGLSEAEGTCIFLLPSPPPHSRNFRQKGRVIQSDPQMYGCHRYCSGAKRVRLDGQSLH
jgi:hypothetical protein